MMSLLAFADDPRELYWQARAGAWPAQGRVCAFLVISEAVSAQDSKNFPGVWVIGAYRAGEQSQLLALAEALGWPFELKHVVHRRRGALSNLLRRTTLLGIDRARSAPLEPPWPDIVIAAGMRNEPVCRWIREASGGRTRIVHVGRPWADPERFDLVITTPQYRLPERSNVLQNTLTMHRVTRARLDAALHDHRLRLSALPAPRISVILGGPSGPYAFGRRAALRLAREAARMARESGGSLLVTTSSRTPEVVPRTLEQYLDVPHEIYRWRPDDPQNPYFAYLGIADRLIVTFDSISMLSEACATGKPVFMFDLAHDHDGGRVVREADWTLKSVAYRALMDYGPRRLSRDIDLVHERLLADGRAAWLGAAPAVATVGGSQDLDRAVTRVRKLMGLQASGRG